MHNLDDEIRMKQLYEKLMSKKTNHTCLYPKCNKKAILSHSISKNTLKNISENNHLIFQQFRRCCFRKEDFLNPKINMKLQKIGINEASTFKGFCKEHDNNIFETIDNNGIVTLKDIFLQLYRTATKQLFFNKMAQEAELKTFQKEYYTNNKFEFNKPLNLENIILFLNDYLSTFPTLNQAFNLKYGEVLWLKPPPNNIPLNDLQILYKILPIKYPIALESSYSLKSKKQYNSNIVILLPTNKGTLLFILCHKDDVIQYTPYFQSQLKTLNFIESLLMMDSEFYLDPKEFQKWSKTKIDIIQKDLYFLYERPFLKEYDVSIFDEIRKEIIKMEPLKIQQHEKNKIKFNPSRADLKTRFFQMGKFIELNRLKMYHQTI